LISKNEREREREREREMIGDGDPLGKALPPTHLEALKIMSILIETVQNAGGSQNEEVA